MDCDVATTSEKTYRVKFAQNGSSGNGLIAGSWQRTYCYSSSTTVSYQFAPYVVNIEGDLSMRYNSEGELIVTLSNVFSTLTGTDQFYDNPRTFTAPLYGSIGGPAVAAWRSFAIAASLSPTRPADNSDRWVKCLGGWYAAGANCGVTCTRDIYGNPPGGTRYVWGSKAIGTRYSKVNGQTPGRMDTGPFQWNLGKVAATAGTQLYLFTDVLQAVTNSENGANCGSQRFLGTGRMAVLGFELPFLNLCPPDLDTIVQQAAVCEGYAYADFTFLASELGGLDGANIVIEYKYQNQSWNDAVEVNTWATKGEPTNIRINNLIPQRMVDWRAKYSVAGNWQAESRTISGSFATKFIPSPQMIATDINEEECTKLGQGRLLSEYTFEDPKTHVGGF